MYDITKLRMLLTTAIFALVAAVFAGGANARIPDQTSSELEGLLRAAQTRNQESGGLSGQAAPTTKPAPTPGSTRHGYVVGGQLIDPSAQARKQASGVLSGQGAPTTKPEATPGSTRHGYVVGGQLITP